MSSEKKYHNNFKNSLSSNNWKKCYLKKNYWKYHRETYIISILGKVKYFLETTKHMYFSRSDVIQCRSNAFIMQVSAEAFIVINGR